MPRRNLTGGWGESRAVTVRLTRQEREALKVLRDRWQCSTSEALRRAVVEAAAVPTAP